MRKFNILIIDDVEDDAELCAIHLAKGDLAFSWKYVDCEKDIVAALNENTFDAVISDYSMVGFDGLAALKIVKDFDVDIPFIMVSGTIGEEVAVNAMKAGTHDYFMKSNLRRLAPAVLREIKDAEIRRAHKQTQINLRESEEKYRTLVENQGEGLVLIDENDIIYFANPAANNIFGVETDFLLRKSINEFIIEENKSDFSIEKGKRIQGEKTVFELTIRAFNDEIKHLLVTATPKFDAESNYKGAFYVFRDITKRKKIECEISSVANLFKKLGADSEKNIRAIVENTSQIIGGIASCYNHLNNKEKSILFWANGVMPSDIGDIDYYHGHICSLVKVKNGDSPIVINSFNNTIYERIDTSINQYSLKAYLGYPVFLQGEIIGSLCVVDDVEREFTDADINTIGTLAKALSIEEERLFVNANLIREKEKAEENDKLKTSFLQNMSHEIRTPMNSIIGFSDLLFNGDVDIEKQKYFCKVINVNANQLLKVVNDVMDISKIENNQIEINNIAININDCLDDVININIQDAIDKKLEIITDKSLDYDNSFVFADDTKLHQILSNLFDNAIKFTEKGSVTLGYEIKGNFIEFFVKDTGIGIAPEFHDLIFDRFSQAKKEKGDLYRGTGLGLSISKGFVEKMGGEIWLHSAVNEGTVFYFTIPYMPKVVLQDKIVDDVDAFHKDVTILFVDDEEDNYLYFNEVVRLLNFNILYAKNGKEAMELFHTHHEITMVFLDIRLPDANGYDIAKEIRKYDLDIIIIAQTAHAFSGEKEKAISNGCNDYLSKPMKFNQIKTMITKYI